MKNKNSNHEEATRLRQDAEEKLKLRKSQTDEIAPKANNLKLIQELEVHQIELETQNDELVIAKEEAELAEEQAKLTEKKYIELYDFAPSGYLTISKAGDILNLNFAAAHMLGKERAKLIKTRFALFIPPETRSVFINFVQIAFTITTKHSCEATLINEGDSPIHVNIEGVVCENKESCLLTVVDITKRKQAEQALIIAKENAEKANADLLDTHYELNKRNAELITNSMLLKESEERLKQAQQIAQLGHWKFDIINNSLHLSDEVYEIFDCHPQDYKETYEAFLELIHPDDRKMVYKAYTYSLQSQNPYEITHRLLMKDGKIKYVQEKCKTIYDENGKPLISEGIVLDITKLKEQENKLHQYSKELKEANATKDRFISILAHDLRSPFTGLLFFCELLIKKIDDYNKGEILEFVTDIHDSANQIYNLLNNLLEWSGVQLDVTPFRPKITNLYDLIYETYMLVKPLAKSKKVRLHINSAKQIEAEIDTNMMKTIIRNLVTNAIKFTKKGERVQISTATTGETIEIKISDNGTGMSKKIKNSLFKIGETRSTRGTNNERGSGFGLLLCKEFVDMHNGTIEVESELNKGSTFTIILPMKIAQSHQK